MTKYIVILSVLFAGCAIGETGVNEPDPITTKDSDVIFVPIFPHETDNDSGVDATDVLSDSVLDSRRPFDSGIDSDTIVDTGLLTDTGTSVSDTKCSVADSDRFGLKDSSHKHDSDDMDDEDDDDKSDHDKVKKHHHEHCDH